MIDISIVARDLNLPPEKVQRTIELLDDGNTIPFITRFRKDETGGLDEQQILSVKNRTALLRSLAERKAFVLKSIESQGKLTDELKIAIDKASSSRALEDAYLPFKPRKKSRAQEAKQKGLGPLADDIFNGVSPEVDLATRATEYVRVDKGLTSVDEVIQGVSDLLAEKFADNVELRKQLRQIMLDTGEVTAQSTAKDSVDDSKKSPEPKKADGESKTVVKMPAAKSQDSAAGAEGGSDDQATKPASDVGDSSVTTEKGEALAENAPVEQAAPSAPATTAEKSESTEAKDISSAEKPSAPAGAAANVAAEPAVSAEAKPATEADPKSEPAATASSNSQPSADAKPTVEEKPAAEKPVSGNAASPKPAAATGAKSKSKKKKKKKKPTDDLYKDYHNFRQPLRKFPHHRVLSINRGERARKLKVKIECDEEKALKLSAEKLIPADHPFADYLKTCVKDSLSRLILPSLERELRRQTTEAAEKHAVDVFANNLRNLLLQPPVRNRRVMAIDPGYKRGCSVAILDKTGEVLHSDHVFVVGNQTRREESKKKVAELASKYSVDIIAIGNGAACREAEQMVSDCIASHLSDNTSIRYVMVNEAGASFYSTSEVGREELPDLSPAARSAVSIGRRLQDPMSELVKISPANIGVGMYQHDVRAKHLGESLEEVVQFCVNQVGVDANTASPSLLSYVSGLNALTARRLVEHRKENGGFKNRDQLKEVSGIGDTTFVQVAGFLRIPSSDCPLDATAIHPESYPIAEEIIKRVDATATELFPQESRFPAPTPPQPAAPAAMKPEEAPAKPDEATSETETKTEAQPATEPQETASAATATATPEAKPEGADGAESKAEPTVPVPAAAAAPAAAEAEKTPPATEPAAPAAQASEAPAEKPQSRKPPARPKPSPELVAARKKRREIVERIATLELDKLASEIPAGKMLLTDIVRTMKRPDWDPREKLRKPVMRRVMLKADDLTPGMELEAQVVNVVDFGVFVDIGIGESCLVHVSQLSNRFIRDPQVVYAIGDVIRTWVSEVDTKKRRVKLTAIRPGTEKGKGGGRRNRKSDRQDRGSAEGNRSGGNRSGRKPKRGRDSKKFAGKKSWKPKPRKPKPVTPITDEMLAGDAPMTSFSDLAQFVKKKPEDNSDA